MPDREPDHEALTTDADDWLEFVNRLTDALEFDGRSWRCDHTFAAAETVIRDLGYDVDATLDWLRGEGATCSCEIGLNVIAPWYEHVQRLEAQYRRVT